MQRRKRRLEPSLSLASKTCFFCPVENSLDTPSECSSFNNATSYTILPGYWALNSSSGKEFVLAKCGNYSSCLPFNCSLSKGNVSCQCNVTDKYGHGQGNCSGGYEGFLCSKCSEHYYRNNSKQCEQCQKHLHLWQEITYPIVFPALFILIILFPNNLLLLGLTQIAVSIVFIIFDSSSQWYLGVLLLTMVMLVILNNKSGENEGTTGVIKTMIFYFQITNILPSSFWPASLEKVLNDVFSVAFHINASSLSCAFPSLSGNDVLLFVLKMLLPFAIILLILSIVFLQRLVRAARVRMCKKKPLFEQENQASEEEEHLVPSQSQVSRSQQIFERIFGEEREGKESMLKQPWGNLFLQVSLFVLYIAHFDLTVQILSIFNCVSPPNFPSISQVDKPYYLASMPWVICNSISQSDYLPLFTLALFFGIVFVVGIPLLFGAILYFHRKRISQDTAYKNKITWFSFYYQNHKIKNYWFELVWMLRRTLIALAFNLSVLHDHSSVQRMIIILLLLSFAIVNQYIQPFRMSKENVFDMIGSLVIVITYTSFFTRPSLITTWTVFAINLLFVLSAVVSLFYTPVKRALQSERGKRLLRKVSCCRRRMPVDELFEAEQVESGKEEKEEYVDILSSQKMSVNRGHLVKLRDSVGEQNEEQEENAREELEYLRTQVSSLRVRLKQEREDNHTAVEEKEKEIKELKEKLKKL